MRNAISRLIGISAALTLIACAFGQAPNNAQQAAIENLLAGNPLAKIYKQGDKMSRVYGNVPSPGFTAQHSAQLFVDAHSMVFGIPADDLALTKTTDMEGKFQAFFFEQRSHGIPVFEGGLTVLVKPGIANEVVLASSQLKVVPAQPPGGFITAKQATAAVRRAMPKAEYMEEPVLLIWGNGEEGRYAYMVRAGMVDKVYPQRYKFFVDARTGAILERKTEVYYIDINGHIDGYRTPPNALPDTNTNPPSLQTVPGARARVIGGNSAYSDASANFTIPHGGSTQVTVEAGLVGRWANVVPTGSSQHVQQLNVTPPGPANFVLNPTPTELITSQVNAFVHTEIVHNFAKAINPAYPGLDIQMTVNVNLNQTCNAYYSNSTINFYRSGGGCPNTAYSSVVYHEYGHHIIAMGHNSPSGDYHEGVADVATMYLLDDPVVGRDFFGPGTNVRNPDTANQQYPCTGEAHTCGMVAGGAFWHMLDELKITMGTQAALTHARYLYLNQILLSPAIDPGLTIDVLTLDDNDGNISNGTPHYFEIDRGFRRHNLAAPPLNFLGFEIYPADTTFVNANETMRLAIRVYDIVGTYKPGTMTLNYRINGGGWQQAKVWDVSETTFGAQLGFIPGQAPGTLIEWYVSAMDTAGHTQNDVDPSTPHETLASTGVTTVLNDNFDTNMGWTVTNDPSLTTGAWERAIPSPPTRGEPPSAQGGSGYCYVTDNRVGNFDVDGGPTWLTSPAFDLTGNGVVSCYVFMYGSTGEDPLTLQVSNNGGASWVNVRTWFTTNNAWVPISFVASKYVTPTNNMRIRIWTTDNPNNSVVEAGFDTVLIRRAS